MFEQENDTKKLRKNEIESHVSEENDSPNEGNLAEDQNKMPYYYDDSTGYEVYHPDEDTDEVFE